MSVKAELKGTELVIYVDGVFDITMYEAFNNSYKPYLDQARSYVIDFRGATNIDSAALGLMLLLRQKAGAEDANISLINANEAVKKVLKIAQFQQLFDIKD
jgi:anti-anti-sigma factor